MAPDTTLLSRLITAEEYQAARGHIFPSPTSLQWFMRRHRPALIEKRAILMPTGRLLVDEQQFDDAVLAIGHANVAGAQ